MNDDKAREARENAWISETMWKLVDEKFSARRDPARDQTLIRRLGHAINASLKGDRRRRAEEAGNEVERLLGLYPPHHREACHQIKGWYWAAVERVPPPNRVTLDRITEEQVGLYRYVLPPGDNIPVSVDPLPVENPAPTEDEIEWAVKLIRNHCSGGTSGMRAEHIKGWLAEARNN